MRKLLSILLLALFGLPAAAPLLALGQTTESRLPACCRRAGDHHCAGNMAAQMEMAAGQGDDRVSPNLRFGPLTPHCPYTPSILPIQHLTAVLAVTDTRLAAPGVAQLPVATHVLPGARTTDDPSCPKRGPPSTSNT